MGVLPCKKQLLTVTLLIIAFTVPTTMTYWAVNIALWQLKLRVSFFNN